MTKVEVLPKYLDFKRGFTTFDYIEEVHKVWLGTCYLYSEAMHLLLDYTVDQFLSVDAQKIMTDARLIFMRDFMMSNRGTFAQKIEGSKQYYGEVPSERQARLGFVDYECLVNSLSGMYESDSSYYDGDPDEPDPLDPHNPETSPNAFVRRSRKRFIRDCENFVQYLGAFLNTVIQKLKNVGVTVSEYCITAGNTERLPDKKQQDVSVTQPKLSDTTQSTEKQDVLKQRVDTFFDQLEKDLIGAPKEVISIFTKYKTRYKREFVITYNLGFKTKQTAQIFINNLKAFCRKLIKDLVTQIQSCITQSTVEEKPLTKTNCEDHSKPKPKFTKRVFKFG